MRLKLRLPRQRRGRRRSLPRRSRRRRRGFGAAGSAGVSLLVAIAVLGAGACARSNAPVPFGFGAASGRAQLELEARFLELPDATRIREAHKLLTEMRCEGNEMIRKRLLKAVHDGELPEGLPLGDIAGFYTTVLHGLAIRARDGATRASMLAAVTAAMAAWPSLIKPVRKRSKNR